MDIGYCAEITQTFYHLPPGSRAWGHALRTVTNFRGPRLPSSSASEELMGSSALDQPSSSGASGRRDVLFQPAGGQGTMRSP